MIKDIKEEFKKFSNQQHAARLQKYFKTGKGEYGEGDIFLGLRVPATRKIAKKYRAMPINEVSVFLKSQFHEERLFALFVLIGLFRKADEYNQEKIYTLYLKNTNYINNWDLVDVTTPKIVGEHLLDKPRDILYQFAKSDNLWKQRIAVLATFTFIKHGDFQDTLKIAQILLHHPHDLIHKAVGWILREIGKQNQTVEEKFLRQYYHTMPRTMLRYAIERFPETLRQKYLKGKIKQ